MCTLLVLPLAACEDADSDPMAVVLTEETRGVLALRTDLPALPALLADADVQASAPRAIQLWLDSWERWDGDGRALRSEAYRLGTPPLVDAVGEEGVRDVLAEVEEAVGATSVLGPGSLSPGIVGGVERARAAHDRSAAALADGETARALALGLEAADALRAVGPRSVATELVQRAAEALRTVEAGEGSADLGEEDLERARRLVRGAKLAMEDRDWTRAIRRAYYAGQLLGVSRF